MLKALAFAPEDGWAFVQEREHVWLLRPPYSRESRAEVSGSVVAKAVNHYGFHAADTTFGSWREIITFLEEQVVSAADPALPDVERLERLLPRAPVDVIETYLDRIESELIPQREWEGAMTLLTHLMRLNAVKSDPELLDRAVDLAARSSARRCREST